MLYDKNITTFMLQLCYDKNSRQTLANHSLRPATLLRKGLWHRCFPVNFAKFIRTPFIIEHLWWLLLVFAILEPFSNKVAGLFNRIPMVTHSDSSLQ